MIPVGAESVFEAVGGMPALLRLAHAWHERALADPVVSHAFQPPVHPRHAERLAAYWAEQLGGPPAWTAGQDGGPALGTHADVVRFHSGNGEHDEMDERAVAAFVVALDDAELPGDLRLRAALTAWFTWATARMSDYPDSPDDVPADLPMPVWTWDGPAA